MLLAAPAPFLLAALGVQLVLAGIDSLRAHARVFWFAALIPAALATTLYVLAFDTFSRTVAGLGIIDTAGWATGFYLAAVAVVAVWTWQSEGMILARPVTVHPASRVAASAIVVVSLVSWLVTGSTAEERAMTVVSTGPVRSNVLLIGIDGVEAQQLSIYGYEVQTTPVIETLAGRGVVFENVFANNGRTYGSLISLLTGKLPTTTHIFFPPAYLTGRDSHEHLPKLLRDAGYNTAQVGMRYYTDAADWNMKGGFDFVNGRKEGARLLEPDRSALGERVHRYRVVLVDRIVSRFLHLAFIRPMEDEYRFLTKKESHSPYFSDERRVRFAAEFIEARREPWFLHIHLLDTHRCTTDCDDRLAEADASVGQLVELVSSVGQLERTLVIIYSDHARNWRTLTRVPLIVVPPGGTEPRRVRNNAQLVDVAPTILDHLGISQPPWMVGLSLLAASEPDARRPIFSLEDTDTRVSSGPEMYRLRDPGPPFYGVRSAAVVVCDRWTKVMFGTNEVSTGAIWGHTAPCRDASIEKLSRESLEKHLQANGYPVDVPPYAGPPA